VFEVGSGIRGLGPTFGVGSHVRGCIPCSGLGPMFEVGSRCQREYSFTWVSLNQYIIGLFQLFVGRLLNSSYSIFE